ncbi:hypothetical protein HZ326_0496 [Fusarium oxysporum f. sp. albedinis]|nr:hypothetical protein HZ326_0496 [Fusarium oxysporum f. sp. albedinis]
MAVNSRAPSLYVYSTASVRTLQLDKLYHLHISRFHAQPVTQKSKYSTGRNTKPWLKEGPRRSVSGLGSRGQVVAKRTSLQKHESPKGKRPRDLVCGPQTVCDREY